MARDACWRDDGTYRVPEPEELAARARKRAEEGFAQKRSRDISVAEAVKKARVVLSISDPATPDNPYCRRKGIMPTETLRDMDVAKAETVLGYAGQRLQGRCLVAPIKRDGDVSSLQLIDGDSRKHFLKGGAMGGGYWAAQPLPDGDGNDSVLLIGEGVATVLSAGHAMPNARGITAMMNNNIPAVARQMRKRYPQADIVILADISKITGEPDKHAVEAAQAVGGRLAVPRFNDGPGPYRKDFNDMAREHGDDAVREVVDAARVRGQSENPRSKPGEKPKPKVSLVLASTIKPEPISWLWEGYLARGKPHILGGKPAAGKTTLAIAMAATVTTGGTWPDGTRCEPGRVVIWSGEDDPADTLVPRLIAAGADLGRVHFVSGAIEDNEPVPFDPAKHLPALAEALSSLDDVALLIVDPVVSAVAGNSYKNAEVRRALQPLADLGAKSNCVVLGITHFTKGTGGRDPVERLTGSLAFGAVARVVLVAAKVEDGAGDADQASNEGRRLMMRAKSNIGPDGGGFDYDLEQRVLPNHAGITTSAVKWGRAVEGSARELLAEAEATDSDGGDSVAEAADWLCDLLAGGQVEQPTIQTKAKAAGHSWATI